VDYQSRKASIGKAWPRANSGFLYLASEYWLQIGWLPDSIGGVLAQSLPNGNDLVRVRAHTESVALAIVFAQERQ
jgi:hypothetical protein